MPGTIEEGSRLAASEARPRAPRPARSSVPGPRVMRLMNPIVSTILRSPAHRLLSGDLLLLTYTGRKTGASHTLPVGYTERGDTLIVHSGVHRWWRNLRGGAPVVVLLRGRWRTARAELFEDSSTLATEVERLFRRFGVKGVARRMGIALDPDASCDDLVHAVEGHALIRLTVDD